MVTSKLNSRMSRLFTAMALLIGFNLSNVYAEECDVPLKPLAFDDLAMPLSSVVNLKPTRDPLSEEPVQTTIVTFDNGNVASIEQKNCSMWNLSITLLSRKESTSKELIAELSTLLSGTPLAKAFYQGQDLSAELSAALADTGKTLEGGTFNIAINKHLQAKNETSEVALENSTITSYSELAAFKLSTTLLISIGGID